MESEYWRALKEGDAASVASLIGTHPELVHAVDEHGKTGLHWAAEVGAVETAALLIDAGADVEARAAWGASPLDWAATMGHGEVAELLLARGAEGLTLISLAALGKLCEVETIVAAGGDLSTHRRRDAPAMPDKYWPSDTAHIRGDVLSDALYAAARNGHTHVVNYLLSRGADVDARGFFGASALHWAAINGWKETADALVASGAAVDVEDQRFEAYPDEWALEGGHTGLAKVLRRHR